jgi:hypothetical protein
MVQNKHLSDLICKIGKENGASNFFVVVHCRFNREIIISTINMIENNVRGANYSSSMVTKLKLISIEILQNIHKHQHVVDDTLPYFIIGSDSEGICIYAGNIIKKEIKSVISDRLKTYNSLNPDTLKSFYLDSLKNTSVSENGNASIGLLDIVYRAKQQVYYNFEDMPGDLVHFGLNVIIKDSKTK